MFPFWDVAIAPVLEALQAKRVVEIGALRGETTVLVLDRLGPDAELHVIDPVPEFDPAQHERKFPGRYIFHRDLSHNVLPHLPAMDAALVDGDHNWYTVYHELTMLSTTAREAGQPLPVLILHDVCWPYGRRDLYYAPERIPDEFRQPFDQQGMRMKQKKLVPRGGLNPTMHNAITEGGPRNGVMTALDDFIAEYDRPLRRLVLPIYFGLAIVAEEALLARRPELASVLDRLENAEGKDDLLHLSEDVRLKAMLFQHNVFYHQDGQIERGARRYLDLLKAALLDEHYLENEVRIDHLVQSLERGQKPEANKLRDPVRHMRPAMRRLVTERRGGHHTDAADAPAYFPYTTMGHARLDHLQQCLGTIRTEAVRGDLVECGTKRGGGAIFMRGFLEAYEIADRQVWVVDPFLASPTSTGAAVSHSELPGGGRGFPDLLADLNTVREGFDRFDLLDDHVRFLQGDFADTLHDAPIEKVALLRIGGDLDLSTADVLDALYDKIPMGGFVVVDDYEAPTCRKAVDEFRARHGIQDPVERVDGTGACWRKAEYTASPATSEVARRHADRAPLAPTAPSKPLDLSVVVVFYNMHREASRTLHSLTRAYQEGIEDLDYEVIVVENGSAPEQKLGDALVRSFGPEFRYLDLDDQATASPANALNRGIEIARGKAFALMIDGAHVLTPGVLRFGMNGLETYEPAIVATQQWYVGPGQQGDVMRSGYDEAYEDRLFQKIEWLGDGYRLFEIGHFIGGRDWLDGLGESNCMFVSRSLLEQVGCFDESFSMPSGGYTNLEFYERLGSAPGVAVTTILGEGSFHQLHGGTTTNQDDAEERRRRIGSYAEHYADLRGRSFKGPNKPIHYVGRMIVPAQKRTKARRMTATELFTGAATDDPDGLPQKPSPIPEELTTAFTEAFWRSLAWRETTWLDRQVAIPPNDLLAYQELIARVRPDWVIETGTLNGGRALFLASICELFEHGRVLSVDEADPGDRPQHPRITYLTGNPVHDSTVRRVRDIVGDTPNALVILGSRKRRPRMLREFEAYEPFVPVGSYVVVEDTIVNGHPVWPSFGPGPAEAVRVIRDTRREFVSDPLLEKFGLTFNPGGFLKRVK